MDKDERSLAVLAVTVYTGLFAALLVGSLAIGGEPEFDSAEIFSPTATAEASRYVCANHSALEDNG